MNQSVSELSRRLENALDTEYNVTDMATVLEIISVLEKTRVTIEQLESTQLTKCVSQMRRRTMDEVLARRSKNLIKQWRTLLPHLPNGKAGGRRRQNGDSMEDEEEARRRKKRRKQMPPEDDDVVVLVEPPPHGSASNSSHIDRGASPVGGTRAEELNFRGKFSRIPSTPASPTPDVSRNNSPSSAFKNTSPHDSRSVSPANQEPVQPKKRGRKKGSRGVDALIGDSYDTSPYLEFKHKLTSGPKKVKTTKELLADLQNRKLTASSATSSPILQIRPTSPSQSLLLHSDGSQSQDPSIFMALPVTDLGHAHETAAAAAAPSDEASAVPPEIPSSTTQTKSIEDEIRELKRQLACVIESQTCEEDEIAPACTCVFTEIHETDELENGVVTKRQSGFGEANTAVTDGGEASTTGTTHNMRRPPVKSIFDLDETDDGRVEIYSEPEEKPLDNTLLDTGPSWPMWRCIEDPDCPARLERGEVTAEDVRALHSLPLEHVNGNWSLGVPSAEPETDETGLYRRVVPQYNHLVMDRIPKVHESDSNATDVVRWHRKRHRRNNNSGSDDEDILHPGQTFREWFETVQVKSYNDELLTILPYVVID
ncbi:mediator of RNA polymerase II transcription subunit 26 [Lutzomyia longipalpis]|uniref:mediator of RNA polymerase II transcription subunit 26 n=1 Tax=Lutzomyia longipalpis TaxID=7200 RepID=UPI002484580F|nr:mediator of RNA polymerase II transcription subunit 26 [Lutzomyia longipalpis]